MTWEQLVVAALLVLALLVQFMRVLKGTVEDEQVTRPKRRAFPCR